jgi:murein DD-endopeptidase MepM/ murein hydrolase activator NlpD
MQIILMHPRFARAKSITITTKHVVYSLVGVLLISLMLSLLITALTLKWANDSETLRSILPVVAGSTSVGSQDKYIKQNLAAMAVKLGEMQAQVMRLDALGERVQGLAGVKPEEFNFKALPPRGGLSPDSHAHALSMSEFQLALNALSHDIENRSDYMDVVETSLMQFKVQSRMLPTIQPVNVAYSSSSYGWRIDPFTGLSAFHQGVDFPAPTGTPIVAAAGGVVIAVEYHPDYGNLLEIDHGNDLVTRYAHCSRILAKVGDIVRRGQHVADIGTTGRSTGAHLHFEVLVKGERQNPNKFLQAGATPTIHASLQRN